ncbi:MAG: hypothetical protein KGR26_03965, partial [Cyanobacteria bacterium REEB65]|nr:hypothetical protein [Cyanobacteria bacterium REEB65]
MRMRSIGAIALASLTVAGCFPGLVYQLDPVPTRLSFTPDKAAASELGLHGTAQYLGPGERIPTVRSLFGNILRVVDPYGAEQIVFDVTVDNASDRLAVLQPQGARLRIPDRIQPARTLQDYKRAWPTYPIQDDDMALDQAAAFGFVVRTLLLEQQLMPGDSAEGRVAF